MTHQIDPAEHEAESIQLAPFTVRVAEIRIRTGAGHAEAKRQALDEQHGYAIDYRRAVEFLSSLAAR